MLEKPPIPDAVLLAAVRAEYGLAASAVTFLPIGYDANTAVYRLDAADGAAYFLKLRKGEFNPVTVLLPNFLRARGIYALIETLPAGNGELWGRMDGFTLLLYPFVPGANAWKSPLKDEQWRAFGAALRAIHNTALPADLERLLPRETYAPHWRERVRGFLSQAGQGIFIDRPAEKLAALLRAERERVERMLARVGQLAEELDGLGLPPAVCHADIHAGNLHVAADGAVYIVDWDNPILAPVERDLMFIGAGMGDAWSEPRAMALFYEGYGSVEVERAALAYYRYERVIEDIAAFCQALWETDAGGADREQSYEYCAGSFLPGREIETAERTDPGE